VNGWEGLEGSYGLPDPNDEHVLATAVVAGAGAIVTHNTRDFPTAKLPTGIEVISPPEFAANTIAVDPVRGGLAVTAIANRSGRGGPLLSEDQILTALIDRYDMDRAVGIIRASR
jgi:hypothetical protein